MKILFKPALLFVTMLALAVQSAPSCAAQDGNPGQRGIRINSTQRELQRMLERDLLYRELEEMAARGPSSTSDRRLVLAQINEDFMRLQMVNNALAQAVAEGDALDFKLVAQAASEMKKRAGRLKSNLALPELEPGTLRLRAAVGAEPEQLKAALRELDGLVISFVSNPGFQTDKVIDAQQSVRARRDIEEIIELCGLVKKGSEQLNKAARKSH